MRITKGLLGVSILCVSGIASADIYKCTGKDGKTSYQATPCAPAEAETKVDIQSPRWKALHTVQNGGRAIYIDENRIKKEGYLIRVWLRFEYPEYRDRPEYVEKQVLFNCIYKEAALVSSTGSRYGDPPVAERKNQQLEWRQFGSGEESTVTVTSYVCANETRDENFFKDRDQYDRRRY